MTTVTYKIKLAKSATEDIKNIRSYILEQFKYRDLAINVTAKIRKAILGLAIFPMGYSKSEFLYRGYNIYYKPHKTYLIFYIVDHETKTVTVLRVMQDGMDWKHILERWIRT